MKNEALIHLPKRLTDEILRVEEKHSKPAEEIRIRANRRASLTYANKNYPLDSVITSEEMKDIVKSMCKNSVYAYKERIASGFISLGDGIRAGIAGSAYTENGQIQNIYDITSIAIRIPGKTEKAATALCEILKDGGFKKSCLIFAPSGIGKTTILRSAAQILSSGNSPLRVCVVDTREELGALLNGSGLCIDILRGYPKDIGIEIATRTLNAQIIICDEIFGEKEAMALCGAVNCGIPILCSAHASTPKELLSRNGITLLHKHRVFDMYVKIDRSAEDFAFDLSVYTHKEVEPFALC